jgi:hypothetical protein
MSQLRLFKALSSALSTYSQYGELLQAELHVYCCFVGDNWTDILYENIRSSKERVCAQLQVSSVIS